MKKTLLALLFTVGALSGVAHAQSTMTLEPIAKPLDPAILQLDKSAGSAFEVRALTQEAADKLLASSEGPAWRILQVQAPACADEHSRDKEVRTECKKLKAECKAAEEFAQSYKQHAACSALYTQTTVLLTNDGSGKSVKAKAKSATKSAGQHKHHTGKAKPQVRKPKAGSC